MQFLESELTTFTTSVWGSFLQMEVQQNEKPFELERDDYLTASIHITGAWNGLVAVDCPRSLTHKAAEKLFMQTGKVSYEEEADSLAEVANMIGGNLKSRLPQPSALDIPVVSMEEVNEKNPEMELITQVTFECEGEQFRVSIFKNNNAQPFVPS